MRPAIVLFLATTFAACETAQSDRVPGAIEPSGETVLSINGDIVVAQNMYDAVMERVPPDQRARMASAPGGMARIEEQLSMAQVLYTRALADNIHTDPVVRDGLAMAERDYLASIYVQRFGETAVTDEAVAARYEERKVQYARPQVKARHILVKEESLANELKGKLEGGADFGKVAMEHSTDPGSKTKGGDLGWFEARRMDPAFSEAAFGAEPGAIVGPVSTRFGFHIIHVEEKRDSVPLEEVREELAGQLKQEAVQKMLETLKTEIKIERPNAPAGEAATPPTPPAAAMPPGHPPVQRPPPKTPPTPPAPEGAGG